MSCDGNDLSVPPSLAVAGLKPAYGDDTCFDEGLDDTEDSCSLPAAAVDIQAVAWHGHTGVQQSPKKRVDDLCDFTSSDDGDCHNNNDDDDDDDDEDFGAMKWKGVAKSRALFENDCSSIESQTAFAAAADCDDAYGSGVRSISSSRCYCHRGSVSSSRIAVDSSSWSLSRNQALRMAPIVANLNRTNPKRPSCDLRHEKQQQPPLRTASDLPVALSASSIGRVPSPDVGCKVRNWQLST